MMLKFKKQPVKKKQVIDVVPEKKNNNKKWVPKGNNKRGYQVKTEEKKVEQKEEKKVEQKEKVVKAKRPFPTKTEENGVKKPVKATKPILSKPVKKPIATKETKEEIIIPDMSQPTLEDDDI